MPIPFEKFDTENAVNVGGVTGSAKVSIGSTSYQLKPSILSNTFLRRLKAGGVDRENFGEVIAAKIGRSVFQSMDKPEAVPELSLVYNKEKQEVLVASKYLTGQNVRTLDKYAEEQDPKIEFRRHSSFVGEIEVLSPGQLSISGDQNKEFRQNLASAIAISALVGDHDVNPGNMMAIDNKVARIDFGHAFNDLLNTSKIFGGGVRNKENQILDFLNREYVAKFPPPGGQSKLWRDYPGMLPCQELADAFKEMSQSNGMQTGIDAAKTEFAELITSLKENNNEKTQKHVRKSLETINEAIGGTKISKKLTLEAAVEKAFDNIGEFCKKNQQQMMGVSKLIQLQVNIDKMLKSVNKTGNPPLELDIDKIKKQYSQITKDKTIGTKDRKSIQWVKTNAKTEAFKGNLQSYMKERGKELGLEKELVKEIAHDKFKLPKKQNIFRRIINKIFGKTEENKTTKPIQETEKSTQSNKSVINSDLDKQQEKPISITIAKKKIETQQKNQSNSLESIIAESIIENHNLFKDKEKISKDDFAKALNNSQSLDSVDRKSFNSLISTSVNENYSKQELTKLIASSSFVKTQVAAVKQIKNLKICSSKKPLNSIQSLPNKEKPRGMEH